MPKARKLAMRISTILIKLANNPSIQKAIGGKWAQVGKPKKHTSESIKRMAQYRKVPPSFHATPGAKTTPN